jgi:hypothetical protein
MTKMLKFGRQRIAEPTQRQVLCDVMLAARECDAWLTLDELAKLTHYPPASISAQLRHLRKPEHGSFVVDKRTRAVDAVMRRDPHGPVWEYQLRWSVRRMARRKAVSRGVAGHAICA